MSHPATPPAARGGAFVTTRWSCVLEARGASPAARAALGELCAAYWSPVFRFLCCEGRSEDIARELTQEFFARMLAGDSLAHADPAQGRFRSYLLGAVKHFLADQRQREGALKRGGGTTTLPLPGPGDTEVTGCGEIADVTAMVPDSYFDRQWAFTLMDRALTRLAEEMAADDKSTQFNRLKPWLVGDALALSQSEAARELRLSEGAVKVAIHRLRKRFREILREEVAQTIPAGTDISGELRYLVEVLATG